MITEMSCSDSTARNYSCQLVLTRRHYKAHASFTVFWMARRACCLNSNLVDGDSKKKHTSQMGKPWTQGALSKSGFAFFWLTLNKWPPVRCWPLSVKPGSHTRCIQSFVL